MYRKKLSELEGMNIAVRVLALAAITAVATMLWGGVVGLVVLAVGLLVGLLVELRPDREAAHPLADAAAHEPAHTERRVLVVANTALAGDDLVDALAGTVAIDILAPPLPSALHQAFSDVDGETSEASDRLHRSLMWARAHGLRARGEVGDPDAIAAIADQLRSFGADEVLVVNPADRWAHGERRQHRVLQADLDVPVREIAI